MCYDVIILGGGPAGLSAAIYARRACRKTLVLEEKPLCGGQVLDSHEVDNYPGVPGVSGFELGERLKAHAEKLGAEFVSAQAAKAVLGGAVKEVEAGGKRYEGRSLILATGARRRELGVPGEKELRGMGVSYCAVCDGAFFRGKDVAVIGGGDSALEDALFLARGCRKVYLVHRRAEFRGAKILQEKVENTENIELVRNRQAASIGGEGGRVSCLELRAGSGSERLDVEGVFIAVGAEPNTDLFKGQVKLDQAGYIAAGEDTKTSVEGVFAAGDVRTKQLRQVVTAAADGANAAASAERYLAREDA